MRCAPDDVQCHRQKAGIAQVYAEFVKPLNPLAAARHLKTERLVDVGALLPNFPTATAQDSSIHHDLLPIVQQHFFFPAVCARNGQRRASAQQASRAQREPCSDSTVWFWHLIFSLKSIYF